MIFVEVEIRIINRIGRRKFDAAINENQFSFINSIEIIDKGIIIHQIWKRQIDE